MARPGLDKHVKFRRLVRTLSEPRPHVRGYLELIWEVAYENGDPFIGDAESIEAAAEYPGEAGTLCAALLNAGGTGQAGFIEEVPGRPGTYQVHDLFHHAPEYVKKRQVRENQRKSKRHDQNGGQRRTTADNGVHCPPMDENGAPPAPAPAPAPKEPPDGGSEEESPALPLADEIRSVWNSHPELIAIRDIAGKRRRTLATRLKEPAFRDNWREAIAKAAASDFCTGRKAGTDGRAWKIHFDFFIEPGNLNKILEGNYDNRDPVMLSAKNASYQDGMRRVHEMEGAA